MKRILILAAIGAVAVVPATSSAGGDSTTKTSARGGGDLELTFTIRSLNGKPVKIKRFKFKHFTVSCKAGGPVEVKGRFKTMKVNDKGKFDGTVRKGGGKVHVEGDFKRSGKIKGTLKAKGKFAPAQGCLTKIGWISE